jgi:ethanolamine permease
MLSVTHGRHKTPHVAMIAGALAGLAVILVIWLIAGADRRGAVIGFTLLNMAVFGAMLSYVAQAVSFILLRRRHADIARPFVSPLGIPAAAATILIAVATIVFQITGDATYRAGIVGVAVWFSVFVAYFAFIGRHRLILSPEEEFAMERRSLGVRLEERATTSGHPRAGN